jgi:hypothetical protein
MKIILNDSQQVSGTISYVDARHQPAPAPKAAPEFVTSDPTVATVSVGANGLVTVVAGNPGVSLLTGKVRGDDGSLIDFGTTPIEVTAGVASGFSGLSFGLPTAQPAAPAPEPTPTPTDPVADAPAPAPEAPAPVVIDPTTPATPEPTV